MSSDPGVDGTNRDYLRYDQVEKRQRYRFAERGGAEEFDEDYEFSTCDLSRWLHGDAAERRALADELGAALRDIGLAILVGHGVDPELYERAAAGTLRLFTSHSLDEKLRFRARRHGAVNQGYFPIRETSDIHPDLVEGWVFCRRAFDLGERGDHGDPDWREFWPDRDSERLFRELCLAHERLILPIMRCLLTFLGADPHEYDARLTRPAFGLRLNYYPPLRDDDARSGAGRLLGHEDVDLFTLLPAPAVEGLQVLNRRSFRWIRLDAPPGSIVLNTGDYMQRISNDVLPSTTHRVSTPRDPDLARRPRVSFPLNVYLHERETLRVLPCLPNPKYAPIQVLRFHTATTAKYYGDDYAVGGPRSPRQR